MKKLLGLTAVSVLILWGAGLVLGPLLGWVGPTDNTVALAEAQADRAEAEALTEVAQWGQQNAQNTQTLARTLSAVVLGLLLLLGLAGWALLTQGRGMPQRARPLTPLPSVNPRKSLNPAPSVALPFKPSHEALPWQGNSLPRHIILEPPVEMALPQHTEQTDAR